MKRILRLLIVILLLLTGCSSQPTTSVDSKDHLNMIKPPETIQSEEASVPQKQGRCKVRPGRTNKEGGK